MQERFANSPTLGGPGAADVFVADAADIAGISTASEMAEALTLIDEAGNLIEGQFAVIEFDTPDGLGCPINRTNPGFEPGGQTRGGVHEYTIPNYDLEELSNVTTRVVR